MEGQESTASEEGFGTLPEELQLTILGWVGSVPDLLTCCLVSRHWRQLAQDNVPPPRQTQQHSCTQA
jgi:hypothetical protein